MKINYLELEKEIKKFNSNLNKVSENPETAVVASAQKSSYCQKIFISDADYLNFLYKLYDHARIRFAAQQEFNLNPEAFRRAFGFKDKSEAIAEFFQLYKRLKEIYRLAEIFQFRLNSNGIRVKFSIDKNLNKDNYLGYPAIFHQRKSRKFYSNKIKHFNKFRDSSTHYEYKHGIKVGGLRP